MCWETLSLKCLFSYLGLFSEQVTLISVLVWICTPNLLKASSFHSALRVRGLFNNVPANLNVLLFYSRNSWKGERVMQKDECFNKALACPLCGLHCWIKSCFHLSHSLSSSSSPPPTQCQVLLWDTMICVCVCVCVREWLSFWQAAAYWSTSQKNRTVLELQRNTLTLLWNTLLLSISHSRTLTSFSDACTHIASPLKIIIWQKPAN